MSEANKNFRKRIGALAAAGVVGITGIAGIIHNNNEKEGVSSTNVPKIEEVTDIKLVNSFENNPNYYNENEIYSKYLELKKELENDNLTKEEVIKICNEYKKVVGSIDYLNMLYIEENREYTAKDNLLAKMPDLYSNIGDNLIKRLIDESIILIPGEDNKVKQRIANEYLRFTDGNIGLEDMYILYNESDEWFYIISKDNELLFRVSVPQNQQEFLSVKHDAQIKDFTKVLEGSSKITDTEKGIPTLSLVETTQELSGEER